MEPIPAVKLAKSKFSNSTITKLGTTSKKTSSSNAELKNMESKKRGVYVEKWADPKGIQAEYNKRQARVRVKKLSKSSTEKTEPISSSGKTELASFTRLLSAPNPALAKELYKPLSKTVTPPTGVPKQTSKTSSMASNNKNKDDFKPQRNIIERNKKQAKMKKFRSNVLRQVYGKNTEKGITFKTKKDIIMTPSNTSKLTRNLSDDAHWSRIFPSEAKKSSDKNQLQYNNKNDVSTSEIASVSNNSKFSSDKKKEDDKPNDENDKNIYNFFIDLLETVYDDKVNKCSVHTLTIVHSRDSSPIKMEIDEKVAEKLYSADQSKQTVNNATTPHSNRYTIKDDDNDIVAKDDDVDQSKMLAAYYNSVARFIPQKTARRPRHFKVTKTHVYTPKPTYTKPEEEVKKKKPKRSNLLSFLKEQLSMNTRMSYEEPASMYEALSTIARNKNKYRQIRFDTPDKESKSDYEGVCRFKRRKVISPNPPRRKVRVLKSDITSNIGNIITSGVKFDNGSVASMNTESNHSLEVYGVDYEENGAVEPDLDSNYWASDRKTLKYVGSITHLNQGIKTITKCWKR